MCTQLGPCHLQRGPCGPRDWVLCGAGLDHGVCSDTDSVPCRAEGLDPGRCAAAAVCCARRGCPGPPRHCTAAQPLRGAPAGARCGALAGGRRGGGRLPGWQRRSGTPPRRRRAPTITPCWESPPALTPPRSRRPTGKRGATWPPALCQPSAAACSTPATMQIAGRWGSNTGGPGLPVLLGSLQPFLGRLSAGPSCASSIPTFHRMKTASTLLPL